MALVFPQALAPVQGGVIAPGASGLVEPVATGDEAVGRGGIVSGVRNHPPVAPLLGELLTDRDHALLQALAPPRRHDPTAGKIGRITPLRRRYDQAKRNHLPLIKAHPPPAVFGKIRLVIRQAMQLHCSQCFLVVRT